MKILDPVYGEFNITEPVLVDLIKSQPMQRLKKIEQFGLPRNLYTLPGFSRYEHCVGVMLLLKMLGSSTEEQAAGLLHDVSHSAFSHLVDWVIGNPEKEDYQDKIHKSFIKKTVIPDILTKHKMETSQIIRIKKWPLLEQISPNLCADRVDYALREFYYWANPKIIPYLLKNLTTFKQKIVFKNLKSAKTFAENFLKLQIKHWGEKETLIRYYLFSLIIKEALQEKIITLLDLDQDDLFVLKKMKQSKNRKILELLDILSKKIKTEINPKLPLIKIKKKFRYVDPWFLNQGKLIRLSKVDYEFKDLVKEEKVKNQEGISFNLITNI